VNDPFLIDECLSAELPAIAHELGLEAGQNSRQTLSDGALNARI
jgi:hypothetical protein